MSQPKSIPGDTPLKKNSAATGVFLEGTLDEQRTAVLTDVGNIPQVTVNFMLNRIVPNLGIDVLLTEDILRKKGVLFDAGWKEFIGALPKSSNKRQDSP